MTPHGIISGIKVFVTENCGTFIARRKHKKRRIAKKWLKKYGEKFEPSQALIGAELCGGKVILCHPKYWDKYKNIFKIDGSDTK